MASDDILERKNIYRDALRKAIEYLFFSILLMLILTWVIFYLYLRIEEPDYYATNSAGFIMPLRVMYEPNNSPNALLPPDPVEEAGQKTLENP